MSDVTRILRSIGADDPRASEELLPLVYEELRKLAAAKMRHERLGQTLQATALVHEAWLDLTGPGQAKWNSRNHFFKAAAEAMRRILIANARRKKREKHGGRLRRIPLAEIDMAEQCDPDTLELVQSALEKLAARDPVKAELVKLRFFIGLKNEEAAQVLGVSPATVKRSWAFARAWMFDEITKLRQGSA